MRTVWGYDVENALCPIVTELEFNTITNQAYAGNPKVATALAAASQAIRNYCGWHIVPSIECTAYPVGGGIITRLPAGYVSAVESVTVGSHILTSDDYLWRRDGLLKRAFPYVWGDGWASIEVTYIAGYDAEAVPDLAETVCAIAAGVLSVAAGVVSESADGVSISYSANASSIAASLTSSLKHSLEPYRLVGAHAT